MSAISYLVFTGRQTTDSGMSSLQYVFSSQKITFSQKLGGLSTYSKAYSMRCSMFSSLSSGFFAGVRPWRLLLWCLFRTVCAEHTRPKSLRIWGAGVNGSLMMAFDMAISCSLVVHLGRPLRGLSTVPPVSSCRLIHRATVCFDIASRLAISPLLRPSSCNRMIASRFPCEVSILNATLQQHLPATLRSHAKPQYGSVHILSSELRVLCFICRYQIASKSARISSLLKVYSNGYVASHRLLVV